MKMLGEKAEYGCRITGDRDMNSKQERVNQTDKRRFWTEGLATNKGKEDVLSEDKAEGVCSVPGVEIAKVERIEDEVF
jgi:hypothetical protein